MSQNTLPNGRRGIRRKYPPSPLQQTHYHTKRTTTVIRIYEWFKQNQIAAGDFVQFQELAVAFDTSVVTIRHAMRFMARYGVIEYRRYGVHGHRIERVTPYDDTLWLHLVRSMFTAEAVYLAEHGRVPHWLHRDVYHTAKRGAPMLRQFMREHFPHHLPPRERRNGARETDSVSPSPTATDSPNPGILLIYRAHEASRFPKVLEVRFASESARRAINRGWHRIVQIYPERAGRQNYGRGYYIYLQLLCYTTQEHIIAEVTRYAEYCRKRGWTGTQWVKKIARFLQRMLNRVRQLWQGRRRQPRARLNRTDTAAKPAHPTREQLDEGARQCREILERLKRVDTITRDATPPANTDQPRTLDECRRRVRARLRAAAQRQHDT